MVRIMDKVKDKQRPDGSFTEFFDDKRVRIEVTLSEAELDRLGITNIQSLRYLKLAAFQRRYFQFKLPTFDLQNVGLHRALEGWRADTYLKAGLTGLMAGVGQGPLLLGLERNREGPGVG